MSKMLENKTPLKRCIASWAYGLEEVVECIKNNLSW